MMRLLAFVLATGIAGCGISEEKFIKRFAKLYCNNLEECGKVETYFGTYDNCVKDMKVFVDDEMIPSGCDIVPEQARACLKELRKSKGDCGINDNPTPSCDQVSGCTGGGQDTGE